MSSTNNNVVLVTGASGFLGKVVVEELRQKQRLSVQSVILLIRPKNRKTAQERFTSTIAPSPCFRHLSKGWTDDVEVLESDLSTPRCGLSDDDYQRIATTITHIIHVAGHVKFDSELSDALACNVDGVLHLLELARRCPKLRQVVVTSTAYVSPPVSAPVVAELVPLPQPAQALYRALKEGKLAKDEALRLTGHPNVYALSKSLAEHLVFEHRRGLPVTIVRPSIISAALQHPEPGWIDSKVAFAALVLCFEKGILKVIDGDGDAKLDIMPVDEVARCLIREAFQDGPSDSTGEANRRTDKTGKPDQPDQPDQSNCPPPAVHSQARITFSTATVRHSLSINEICLVLQRFFSSKYPTQPRRIRFVGHGCLFKAYDALYHSIPLSLHSAMWRVLGRPDVGKRSSKALHIVKAMNAAFRYYTRQTYDFQAGEPSTHLDPEKYLEIVREGVCEHLLS